MPGVRDVAADTFIKEYASHLKRSGESPAPYCIRDRFLRTETAACVGLDGEGEDEAGAQRGRKPIGLDGVVAGRQVPSHVVHQRRV